VALPVLSLVTQLLAFNRLTKKGITSWDEKLGFSISHGPISALRVFCYIIAFPAVMVMAAVLGLIVHMVATL
jgi:hypothetical protein